MPGVALLPLLIGAGASVAGAAISSHAATSAAQTQAKSASDALQVEKDQFARAQQTYAPYLNLAATALPALTSLAGRSTPNLGLPGNVANPYASVGTGAGPMPPTASPYASGAPYGASPMGGGMLRMQAPTGEIQQVPAARRAFYEARGAKVIA